MKEKRKPGKKKALLFGAGGTALLLGGMAAGYLFVINREEEPVYREETVQYGTLTVGLQETGSVEVGTAEQTFELDMSAYTESGSGSFSWEQPGGNVFQGMTAGGSAASAERTLTVEEILVTEGQEVSEGEPLYRLAQDSIEEIREELAADVADAQVTLEQTQTQLAMTRLDAQQEYDTDTAYAETLAQAEYDTSLSQLQEAVTEIEEQMMAGGLLEEVRALLARGVPAGATSLQAIGYKEPMAALRGEITLEQAAEPENWVRSK